MGTRRKSRSGPRGVPTWEQPPPPEVLALLSRFPDAGAGVLALRHAMLFAISGIALWGILTKDWTATPLLVYFGAELLLVMVLNFACIATLPVALKDNDRTIVKGWAWFASIVLFVTLAYASVEGIAAVRDPLVAALGDFGRWIVRERIVWPLLGMVALHLVDLSADIAFWRKRGGQFHYWAGISFMFRLWFCFGVGLFVAFFGWILTQEMDAPRRTAIILWLVFLGADLFATWVPVWIRKKAVRQGHLAA